MDKKIEVAIAEGNALMLTALSELIEKDGRFSLVSTVTSTESCLQTVLSVSSDVLVIDWALPTFGAEKLIKVLREQGSAVRVVVCTHTHSLEIAKRSMGAGAAGFFCHADPSEELLDVIEEIAKGNMFFPYLDVRELTDPLQSLTKTERSLLGSLSKGLSNKELAEEHFIALNTVKFHLRNLFDKLSVNNRSQAIAYYYSLSLPESIPGVEMSTPTVNQTKTPSGNDDSEN
jgi:two-component system nitrate/nitrite response regulator NarP